VYYPFALRNHEGVAMNVVTLQPEVINIRKIYWIYDKYRTALLNVKYYGHKLIWARRINLYMELLIAVTASSGVSGWAIWGKEGWALVWSLMAGAAAILATVKPLLPLTKNVATYSKLFGGHKSNYHALEELVKRIETEQVWTKEMEAEFAYISKQDREMAGDDDPKPSKRLVAKFTEEVNLQIPVDRLWCPGQ